MEILVKLTLKAALMEFELSLLFLRDIKLNFFEVGDRPAWICFLHEVL